MEEFDVTSVDSVRMQRGEKQNAGIGRRTFITQMIFIQPTQLVECIFPKEMI